MNFKKVFSTVFICFFLVFSLNHEASAKGRGIGGKAAKSFIGALAKNFGSGKRAAISAQAKARNKLIPRTLRGFQGMKPRTAQIRKSLGGIPIGKKINRSQKYSPYIHPKMVNGKTPKQLQSLAKRKGLIPNNKQPGANMNWDDPITKKQRLSAHNINTPDRHNHLNPLTGKKGGRLDSKGNIVSGKSRGAHLKQRK